METVLVQNDGQGFDARALTGVRDDASLTLPDGRRIAYAEFGEPDGAPCFYFHFTPGSRLEPQALFSRHPFALRGIRLIAIDRPGFGRSDYQPDRAFLHWPDDVAAVADSLGIDRFAVLGLSGGGAYACACAYRIPDRITSTILVSGMGPAWRPEAQNGMARINRLMYTLSCRSPRLARGVTRIIFWALLRSLTKAPRPSALPHDFITDPAARPALAAALEEAVVFPGTRGLVQELALYARPWGFRLEDIETDVMLWHARGDTNVPIALARYMTTAIPRCHATFVEGGHTAPFERLDDILSLVRGRRLAPCNAGPAAGP